eukprot:5131607-Pleurochrysis_carterae.AAC.1
MKRVRPLTTADACASAREAGTAIHLCALMNFGAATPLPNPAALRRVARRVQLATSAHASGASSWPLRRAGLLRGLKSVCGRKRTRCCEEGVCVLPIS